MLELFLWLVFIVFTIINLIIHNDQPQRILLLNLTIKLKFRTLSTCQCHAGSSFKTDGLFTLFPYSPSPSLIHQNLASRPHKDVCFGHFVCHLGWSAFWIVLFLASTSLSDSLACQATSRVSLDLVTVFHLMHEAKFYLARWHFIVRFLMVRVIS